MSPSTSETTPLLAPPHAASSTPAKATRPAFFSPLRRIFLSSFFLSLSFSFTQTPLFYAMKVMTCQAYYDARGGRYDGSNWEAGMGLQGSLGEGVLGGGAAGGRCEIRQVEAQTARNIALMSSITTTSSIINLFLTGYLIRTYGPKLALFQQTIWSCVRNVCQILALSIGSQTGIHIFRYTQLINILGGGGGYLLSANAFVAILSEGEERTSMFGVLQGVAMLGTGLGYSLGGIISDTFTLSTPFRVTLCLLVFSTLFAAFFLPYIPPPPPPPPTAEGKQRKEGIWGFLAPLRVLGPKTDDENEGEGWRGRWGVAMLGMGLFLGVVATGYVPLMLQQIGTNLFSFLPSDAGLMMSANALVRAFFLMVLFPRIISSGRRYLSSAPTTPTTTTASTSTSTPAPQEAQIQLLPGDASNFDPPRAGGETEEPTPAPKPTNRKHGSSFDLHFLRLSLVLDGALTALVAFATKGSHIYLAAVLLPFASGSAPAGKGVIMEMVAPADRADALSCVALLERLAQVTTIGVFGAIFAELSEEGRPTVVFFINGATALLAAMVLMFVRLPGSGGAGRKQGRIALA